MGEMRPGTTSALTASGMGAVRGEGKIGAILITPGSDATTIQIWDSENSTTTNDTTLFYGKFVANAKTEAFHYVPGILFDKGVYVAITGTSVSVIVYTY